MKFAPSTERRLRVVAMLREYQIYSDILFVQVGGGGREEIQKELFIMIRMKHASRVNTPFRQRLAGCYALGLDVFCKLG